jgi:hypothetical protein
MPSREELEQMVHDLDWSKLSQCLPFNLVLLVMPLNFQEFWKLIQQNKYLKVDFSAKNPTFGGKQEEL